MGLRATIESNKTSFKAGFTEAIGEEVDTPLRDRTQVVLEGLAKLVLGTTRPVLYGYLLVSPSVPFLPWGRPPLMAITVVAGIAASAFIGKERPRLQVARFVLVLVLAGATLHYGAPPSTSIVLIGSVMVAVASTAQTLPFLYGLVVGYTATALLAKAFGWNLFDAEQLPLSGRPYNVDDAAAEALRFGALMFITGLMHFSGFEIRRLEQKAKSAEEARSAAVVDERARIARELHDVVSHHVTAMTLQAEAAAITGDKTALTSVARAGRDALTELRRMLGVLRHPGGDDAAGADGLVPQPGLDSLDALAQRTSSGPAVRVERRGDVRPLPAGVELCAYRIVQEALTNSAKHSDATTVDVVLSYGPADLTVEVVDDGRSLAVSHVGSGGLGLVGMNERVALLEGALDVGPREDAHGYRVHARLPLGR